MIDFMSKLNDYINIFLANVGILAPIIGCILILFESIIPIIPLCAFITLNFLSFGNIIGFIISWVFTVLGCMLSFWIFDRGVKNKFEKRLRNKEAVNKFMLIIDDIKFEYLVALIAIPFTPAFAINIAAGLSNMSYKKYLKALLIGKIFMVYFWGYIGTSLIESLTNPIILLKVIGLLLIAFALGKILSKKMGE